MAVNDCPAPVWPHPQLTARSEAEWNRLLQIQAHKLVFVFGSNLGGRHGGKHAQHAVHHFDAVPGKGYGWHGRSYALPVMDVGLRALPLPIIWGHVARFLQTAAVEPTFSFYVTGIGQGVAGILTAEIAPLFADRTENVLLPPEWLTYLRVEQLPPMPSAVATEAL